MKILITSIPGAGHLNPLLSIASLLVESSHEVAVQVNEDLRSAVEAAGHRFLSEIPAPDRRYDTSVRYPRRPGSPRCRIGGDIWTEPRTSS